MGQFGKQIAWTVYFFFLFYRLRGPRIEAPLSKDYIILYVIYSRFCWYKARVRGATAHTSW